LCKSTARINTSTDTAYTDIHKSNVPSLRLEQSMRSCASTPREVAAVIAVVAVVVVVVAVAVAVAVAVVVVVVYHEPNQYG